MANTLTACSLLDPKQSNQLSLGQTPDPQKLGKRINISCFKLLNLWPVLVTQQQKTNSASNLVFTELSFSTHILFVHLTNKIAAINILRTKTYDS